MHPVWEIKSHKFGTTPDWLFVPVVLDTFPESPRANVRTHKGNVHLKSADFIDVKFAQMENGINSTI